MKIPKEDIKRMVLVATIYLLVYVAIHLKNYLQVGELFGIIKGDNFDKAFQFISIPGFIPTFMLIVLIFQNIHNYPSWFLEIFTFIFNCLFYGYVFGRCSLKFVRPS